MRRRWDDLSPRQAEVAALIAAGRSSKEIARRLAISPLTVGKHRRDAFRRLGVRSAAGLSLAMRALETPVP